MSYFVFFCCLFLCKPWWINYHGWGICLLLFTCNYMVYVRRGCLFTVGKHTPCGLSFVYTSYIRYGVRVVPKFGKHALLFSYHKGKKYV